MGSNCPGTLTKPVYVPCPIRSSKSDRVVRIHRIGRGHDNGPGDSSGPERFPDLSGSVVHPWIGTAAQRITTSRFGDTHETPTCGHVVLLLAFVSACSGGSGTPTLPAPDDTLCVNNVQDSPELGPNYVCRSVRVVARSAGVMTLEARSTTNGPPPLLEVEIVAGGNGPCCPVSRTPPRFRSPPERRLWHMWKCPSVRSPADRSP